MMLNGWPHKREQQIAKHCTPRSAAEFRPRLCRRVYVASRNKESAWSAKEDTCVFMLYGVYIQKLIRTATAHI